MNITESAVEEVSKGGERQARFELYRVQKGVGLRVWVHPDIEALVASWGTGERQPVKAHGRLWLPERAGQVLEVWQLQDDPGSLPYDLGLYRINRVGKGLLEDDGIADDARLRSTPTGRSVLNLSHLRLCGVSEGAGVTFHIHGVYEYATLLSIAEQLKLAARAFYLSFLRPVHVAVTVSTQHLK